MIVGQDSDGSLRSFIHTWVVIFNFFFILLMNCTAVK